MRIAGYEPRSRANGPGARFVVWMQGCSLGCVGCFNQHTHDPLGGTFTSLDVLVDAMKASKSEGLSLSGGEPLQHADDAIALLDAARSLGMSTLAFSGYTIEEIHDLPRGDEVLSKLDVLIDGRYVSTQRLASGLRGSANQQIRLLTNRYSMADVENTPVAEIRIGANGELVLTGVDPLKLKR